MDVLLAPDVFVNASVAPGSPPDEVVQRILGKHKGESSTSQWILDRVAAMLAAVPSFKKEAVDPHIGLIKGLVKVVKTDGKHDANAWEEALAAAAKAAGAKRVITDHPDLLEKGTKVEFISTEAWLLEQKMPPPPPPPKKG